MNESNIRSTIFNLLARAGYWPYSPPNLAHLKKYMPSGRPDILCLHPILPSIVAECKDFTTPTRFDFAEISADQRAWMMMWRDDRGAGFLALGSRDGRAGNKANPRYIWLIPWSVYLNAEASVHGRASFTKEDAIVAFRSYALEYYSSEWHLPYTHPLSLTATQRDMAEWRAAWKSAREAHSHD